MGSPGAMGSPRQAVQPGLSSSETALQSMRWGLPLGPDDPPSGPQLAGPWLWPGTLSGQHWEGREDPSSPRLHTEPLPLL